MGNYPVNVRIRQLAVMRWTVVFNAITVLLLGLAALVAVPVATAGEQSERTVLVLGDSLSSAYGMSTEQGWVSLLQARLDDESADARASSSAPEKAKLNGATQPEANNKWLVVNASIAGDTATSGATRIAALLDRHRPSLVIVELGGNDGLRGTPVGTIKTALSTILDLVRDAGASPVLLGMRMPPNYGPRYVADFHAVYQSLAQQRGIAFVPFLLDGVATEDGMMQADRIHPAAAAQATMLDTVWTVLQPLLW